MSRTAVSCVAAGVLTLLVGAAGAPTANARQSGGDAAARAQKVQQALEARANKQAKSLGLTPEQTKQLVQINSDALKQLAALKTNPPADKMEAAKAFKSILTTRKAALGKLFSPAQMAKYTATNQKDAASLVTAAMNKDLTLTNDQMQSINALNLAHIQKVTAALGMSDKTAALQALKTEAKAYDSALEKILTPEQWKQYQAHVAAGQQKQ
jgi:hypothetical protein